MVEFAGHTLNWLAAGALFPLMLLPAAAMASNNRATSSVIWLIIVAVIAGLGFLFVGLVPSLRLAAPVNGLLIFAGSAGALGAAIFITGGATPFSRAIAPLFEDLTKLVGRTVMWLLLIMALLQFAIVLLRYVFGVNEIFMQESITYMHGAVFLLAAGYALLTNDHVRVDIFYREASAKRKAVVDLLGTYLFLFPVCLVIVWAGSPYVARSWAFYEGSAESSGIQGVFLLKSLIPAFAVLLAMAGFVIAHKAVETLKGRAP